MKSETCFYQQTEIYVFETVKALTAVLLCMTEKNLVAFL